MTLLLQTTTLIFSTTIRGFHEFCTNALIAIIFIHVAAAIYHHFVVKDENDDKYDKVLDNQAHS